MAKKTIDLKEYAKSFHSAPVDKSRYVPEHAPVKPAIEPAYEYRKGYVYYCADGQGRVKIGFSANPWSRCSENRCWNPDNKLLAVERGTFPLEHQRQEEFREYHLALEWFKLEGRLADYIKTLDDKWDGKD